MFFYSSKTFFLYIRNHIFTQVKDSPSRISTFVSHEISIMLWVLLPVIALFIASSNLIVEILYSSEFLVILPFIVCAVVGTIFRAISWCMAYVILARGDGKIYLLTESASAITSIVLNIVAYSNWGLDGLGVAYVMWYIIYTLIIGIVYRGRYNLTLGKGITQLTLFASATSIISVVGYFYIGWIIPLVVGLALLPFAVKRILRKKTN